MLDEIRIQSPCETNWDEMEGNDVVRFCQHCKSGVHNLSSLSRKEAEKLVAESKGSICVRYYRDINGKIVTADAPRPLMTAQPTILAASFSALLSLPAAALAQQTETKPQVRIAVENRLQPIDAAADAAHSLIRGKVVDPATQLVVGANVTLMSELAPQKRVAVSDQSGEFLFSDLPAGRYSVTVEATGFNLFAMRSLEVKAHQEFAIEVTLQIGSIQCETVQVRGDSASSVTVGTLAMYQHRSWWQWVVYVVSYPFKQGKKVLTR